MVFDNSALELNVIWYEYMNSFTQIYSCEFHFFFSGLNFNVTFYFLKFNRQNLIKKTRAKFSTMLWSKNCVSTYVLFLLFVFRLFQSLVAEHSTDNYISWKLFLMVWRLKIIISMLLFGSLFWCCFLRNVSFFNIFTENSSGKSDYSFENCVLI